MNRQKIFKYLDYLIKIQNPKDPKYRKYREELKGAFQDEIERPENINRIYAGVLDDYVYQRFMSVTARKAGFGLDEVAQLLTWIGDELDIY